LYRKSTTLQRESPVTTITPDSCNTHCAKPSNVKQCNKTQPQQILPETLPARNSKIKLKSLKVQNSKTTAEPEFTTIKA
jgi:hypothetical protein